MLGRCKGTLANYYEKLKYLRCKGVFSDKDLVVLLVLLDKDIDATGQMWRTLYLCWGNYYTKWVPIWNRETRRKHEKFGEEDVTQWVINRFPMNLEDARGCNATVPQSLGHMKARVGTEVHCTEVAQRLQWLGQVKARVSRHVRSYRVRR